MEDNLKSEHVIPDLESMLTSPLDNGNRFLMLRERYCAMNDKKYTQAQFAKKLGLSVSKVSELEKGKRLQPSISEALAYNELTGASLEYLFEVTTKLRRETGLSAKALNHIKEMSNDPNCENAFRALNQLLASPDAAEFLNMLFQLWISPIYSAFDIDISQSTPLETAILLHQQNTPQMAYAVRCNVERQLLNYIDNHGFYQSKYYDDFPASQNAPEIIEDELIDE